MSEVQYFPFLLLDQPTCVWDWDLSETNRRFLQGIDPAYFEHLVKVHVPLLDGEERQYAATALRAGYTHGLETLFVLLTGAAVAPEGIGAWMLRYRNFEMEALVTKMHDAGKMLERVSGDHPQWSAISKAMHGELTWHDADQTAKDFAALWSRLAEDYIDPTQQTEYNNFKHGLRLSMGGFSLAMGLEETPGVPAPAANMRLMGKSEFGSSFYEKEDLAKFNIRLKRRSVNWDPRKYMYGLQLISMSINNVVSYLRVYNGENPDQVEFKRPDSVGAFEEMWRYRPSLHSFDMNSILTVEMIKPLTKEEIIKEVEAYQQNQQTP